MKVKRYVVQDLPEAVQKIRAELGSDAVILNTKEIRIGGFLGMFRKKRVEVFAAIDEQSARSNPAAAAARALRPQAQLQPRAVPPTASAPPSPSSADSPLTAGAGIPDEPGSFLPPQAVRSRYSQGNAPRSAAPVATLEPAPTAEASAAKAASAVRPPAAEGSSQGAAEAALELIAGMSAGRRPSAEERGAPPPPVRGEPWAAERQERGRIVEDETAQLLQELRAMKEMMKEMNRQQSFRIIPEPVMKLAKTLAEQGVEPYLVERFAETVMERVEGGDADDAGRVYEAASGVLREWLLPSIGQGISANTRIVNFVGPTGVGKTTTIAKLAADQAFVHRRAVGFITADTYRIAAVDQLRTYAEILNIPLEVVFSSSELPKAYRKLEDRDLIFMDTAGRNYRNELFVSEVNALLSPGEQSESILVLSLTHKYQDMKQVAAQFAKYGVKRLLFTKMDETDSFGSILNLVQAFDYEISYLTCGQTVPDDIRNFDPEDMIRRLLGELRNE
ncbi:flagellar biosynthesis protein FlhF [Cohnella fermenti]|uniref:Flagellar biosynthesis protein FlhF n=1 Tax=Cohnella fermenti TaxID=2565925 RepID=A0A4S4C2I9_9BACL|nr:flagellar biosynthesis protein FlhF [Cohnella fermenti]THF81249.1 flagellar biosynthesis protein FlhF [Cohnella fermenti]